MRALRIGLLLGLRQIQRASKWTTFLIIFVMTLTFLNLVAVSGILVGIPVGAMQAVSENSLGDIVMTAKDDEDFILETEHLIKVLNSFPEIESYSVRHEGVARLEANYQERRDLGGERDIANVTITGIDPVKENETTKLSEAIIVGEYLDPEEEGYILIGAYYVEEYSQQFGDIFETLEGVQPGDTVRLTSGDITKEFTIKGIVQSLVDEVTLNTYIPEREFRRLFGRHSRNADKIAIQLHGQIDHDEAKAALLIGGLGDLAKIQTFKESVPKFIVDIKDTFDVLGALIGSIGIVVASVTIFIIIFVNALSRRRHIGILKGIGLDRKVIEIAYVLQSAFYVLAGSFFGALITYLLLVPYFNENPIKFPFSDGILVADPEATFFKFIILFFVTLLAGLLPAWIIVKQNTLNSILGRK